MCVIETEEIKFIEKQNRENNGQRNTTKYVSVLFLYITFKKEPNQKSKVQTDQTNSHNQLTHRQSDRRYLSGDSVKQLRLIGQWATRPTALPTCQQEMPTLPHCLTGQNQPTTTTNSS